MNFTISQYFHSSLCLQGMFSLSLYHILYHQIDRVKEIQCFGSFFFFFLQGAAVYVCVLFSIWEMENLAFVSVSQLVSLDDSGICYHMKFWTRKGRMKPNQGIHLAWIFLQCVLISNCRWSW